MSRTNTVIAIFVFGAIGALLTLAALLMIPDGGTSPAYREVNSDQLPTLVVLGGLGFISGAITALVLSGLQRLMAPHPPRA